MKLSREEVLKIAVLSRLNLTDSEATQAADQLSNILSHIEELKKLSTEGIEPTAHAFPVATPLREDRAIPGKLYQSLLEIAPDREGNLFRVPKVL